MMQVFKHLSTYHIKKEVFCYTFALIVFPNLYSDLVKMVRPVIILATETGQQIDVPKEDRIVNEIIENEDYIHYCDFPAVNLRNQFRMFNSTTAYSFLC
jgi:hypothetical protein